MTTKSGLVRAHANATDPSAAVDQVVDRLQRQVKKRKTRRVDRTQHAEGVKAIPPHWSRRSSGRPRGRPRPPGRRGPGRWATRRPMAEVVYRRPDGDSRPDKPEP